MIPADGAHCCDRSSKVQDLNSTATVETRFMQFRTCVSQEELYKRIHNSLVFLAKKWKSLYFRSSKVCDSTPCFQSRFWRCSSDLSETISCQWSLEVYRTATKALYWQLGIQKTLFKASTFSTPALRGLPHSSQHQQLRRAGLSTAAMWLPSAWTSSSPSLVIEWSQEILNTTGPPTHLTCPPWTYYCGDRQWHVW